MRVSWRGLLALSLLAGFFVVAAGIVLGLAGFAIWSFAEGHGGAAIKLVIGAVIVGMAVVTAVRSALAIRHEPGGVPLTRHDQPVLWQTVDELAAVAGTRGPDDIRLVPEVNASVSEEAKLLGLRSGRRYLQIGLPLLAGMSVGELRAVLAHELGHYGAGHTKSAALTYRAKTALEQTLNEMRTGPVRWLLRRYATLYAIVAASANRRQEHDADATAVAAAGLPAAVSAIGKLPAMTAAWDAYQSDYLGLAGMVGRTPALLGGFHSFLADPARRTQLATIEGQLIDDEPRSVFDSHPPIRKRLEAMNKLPDPGVPNDERPAWSLLADASATLPALERQLLVDDLGPAADWPEIIRLAGAENSRRGAALLAKAGKESGAAPEGTIEAVLGALRRGELLKLAHPVVNPAIDPARVAEASAALITEYLGDAVVATLTESGAVSHELNWGGPSRVATADGADFDVEALVAPAVTDPAKVDAVQARLVELGVPLSFGVEPAGEITSRVLGVLTNVKLADAKLHLVVCQNGLLMAAPDSGVEGLSVEQARRAEGTVWVDTRAITSARMRRKLTGWELRISLFDGAELGLRNSTETEERGEAYAALRGLLGSRLVTKDD